MRYRQLKCGEIIEATDEYISFLVPDIFVPVSPVSVGQAILECNVKYYRRPINSDGETADLFDAALTKGGG